MIDVMKSGLHPRASNAFKAAGVPAWRIGQTVGEAKASEGAHEPDGSVGGQAYSAATDLHVSDLKHSELPALMLRLARVGFAPFARIPGTDHWPAGEAYHMHVVYAGIPMKAMLEHQVRDFLAGLNGLASHVRYTFWQPDSLTRGIVGSYFNARRVVHEEDDLEQSTLVVDGVKNPALYDPSKELNYIPFVPAVKTALMKAGFGIGWDPKAHVVTLTSPHKK